MPHPTRVTLNGSLGSGKSTVGHLLAKRLGIEHISTGQIFREIGRVNDLDALQANLAAENNTAIDKKVDDFLQNLYTSPRSFVIDSRMAWHFIHDAKNVYLDVSAEVGADRIYHDLTRFGETYSSVQQAKENLQTRRNSERKRYRRLYDVDIENSDNYDLLIATENSSIDAICELIIFSLQCHNMNNFWMAKCRLVPLMSIRELSGQEFVTSLNPFSAPPLCLYRINAWGCVYENPYQLAQILMNTFPMTSFRHELPPYLKNPPCNIQSATRGFSLSHFYDWSELLGPNLEIVNIIKKNEATH